MNSKSGFFSILPILIAVTMSSAGTNVGKVKSVSVGDPNVPGAYDYITMAGLSLQGNCAADDSGLTKLAIRESTGASRQISIALTALSTGKDVQTSIQGDYYNSNGGCYLRWIKILD